MKFIFALFLTCNLCAQIGRGEWSLHFPNKSGIDLVVGNNVVYTTFESGVLEFDIALVEQMKSFSGQLCQVAFFVTKIVVFIV